MSLPAPALPDRVRATLDAHSMIEPGETVLVAVSGGPDSVCLLHVLLGLGIPCGAAHVDHQTRNGESAREAAFVREWTASLGVTCCETARPVTEEAAHSPDSFEMHARRVRYAFFVEMAKAQGHAAVATGHHRDDQAETVLMRVLRGTSPAGLAGIPPRTTREGVRIIRPLLDVTRREILEYLHEHQIAYCRDSSNEALHFLRNRMRRNLVPQLEREYNPRLADALVRLAQGQRTENALLEELLGAFHRECITKDGAIQRDRFREVHEALQHRLIMQFGRDNGVELDFDRVSHAAEFVRSAAPGKKCELGQGLQLCNGRDESRILAPEAADRPAEPVELRRGETAPAFGHHFRVMVREQFPRTALHDYCTPRRQVFDADTTPGRLAVRAVTPGDRFRPLGLGGGKKVFDYLGERAVPVWERHRQLVITADDRVIWVVGGTLDQEAAVTDATRRFLEIEMLDETQ